MSLVQSPGKGGAGMLPPSKETKEMRFEDFRVRKINRHHTWLCAAV
jgi:hypothetical protein